MNDLDQRLLEAHQLGDLAVLATLYAEAAEQAAREEAAGFYLTHAYVYALDAGLAQAQGLRARLVAMGREEP